MKENREREIESEIKGREDEEGRMKRNNNVMMNRSIHSPLLSNFMREKMGKMREEEIQRKRKKEKIMREKKRGIKCTAFLT